MGHSWRKESGAGFRLHKTKQEPRGSSHGLEVNVDLDKEYTKETGKNIIRQSWLIMVDLCIFWILGSCSVVSGRCKEVVRWGQEGVI